MTLPRSITNALRPVPVMPPEAAARALAEIIRLRALNTELLAALKEIRDQTYAIQHSKETRLDDIYDMANAAIQKALGEVSA